MARSNKKGWYISEGVIRAFKRHEENNKIPIKIWDRSSAIHPLFIGKKVLVYNGKKWVPVSISEMHVGHKFGEFSLTRQPVKHPVKKGGSKK